MAKSNPLINPRLPRGFGDRDAAEIAATDRIVATIREVYERYGFDPVETPFFEYTETLGKFLPDEDRPNQGVFSLQDDDELWMSLRYDLTAPLARHFAENFENLPKPYRTYRAGYVFRNEKPGPGRFRQFLQLDADTVGAAGPEADAEMCMMMADTMDALGLKGKYTVKVSNRKSIEGLRSVLGVADDSQWLIIMRSIDKFDKVGAIGVAQLLGGGRTDESGDFIPGAGLPEHHIAALLSFFRPLNTGKVSVAIATDDPNRPRFELLDESEFHELARKSGAASALSTEISSIDASALGKIQAVYSTAGANVSTNELAYSGYLELYQMARLFKSAGYDSERIRIDPSVVRGLEYYTGPVFEIELTFPVTNEKGEEVVFGAVGGGGRYDGLVSRFRREPVPATGFSIGVSRLAHALKLTGNLAMEPPMGPVVVCVMDRDQKASYQAMVAELRAAGIRSEMFLGNPKNFGKQLAYADKRNAPAVIIEGSDERERKVIQIKDLIEGKRAGAAITDNAEWKAERPGQFECARSEMVARIKELPAVAAWLKDRPA